MIDPVAVRDALRGLSEVVQQHREAQHGVRKDGTHGVDDVLADRVHMMLRVLLRLHAGVEIRQDDPGDAELVHRADLLRVRRDEQLHELRADALGAHRFQMLRVARDCRRRVRVDRKAQLRREPHRAHDAQRVLREALVRVADAADRLQLQVAHAAEEIHEPLLVVVGHRVDGEVAAAQILRQVRRKCHFIRVAAVRVRAVDPVGRDLEAVLLEEHGHRAVRKARVDRAAEQPLHREVVMSQSSGTFARTESRTQPPTA